jgi:hypothetical protein
MLCVFLEVLFVRATHFKRETEISVYIQNISDESDVSVTKVLTVKQMNIEATLQ